MRPRVKSYGLISTRTRSPSKMRIRNLRIFPPVYASSSCPLSSLTLNCVFGSASTTVPSISIASFLGTAEHGSRLHRQARALAEGSPRRTRMSGTAPLGLETVGAEHGFVAPRLEWDTCLAVAAGAGGHKHLAAWRG